MTTVYPTSIKIYIYYNSTWNDISSYVVSELKGKQGLSGTNSKDRVASIGTLDFELDNSTGKFTPGGDDVIDTEWDKGIPIKVDITFQGLTHNVFWGRVENLELDTVDWGEQRVSVEALDYMEIISKFPLSKIALASNKRINEAVSTIVSSLPIAPQNTDYETGVSLFPTVFDAIKQNTRAASEFQKLALSERGFIYVKSGDTLRVEASDTRNGLRTPKSFSASDGISALLMEDGGYLLQETGDKILLDRVLTAIFNNNMIDSEITYGKDIINDARISAYPRVIGTAYEVLYSLGSPIYISGYESVYLKGQYSDPDGGNTTISGTSMQTPVATTDYLMNSKKDGTGSNLTANLTVTATYYADGVEYELSATTAGWVTKLQARGYKVSKYSPIVSTAENAASKTSYGPNTTSIKQTYQDSYIESQIEAEIIVEEGRKAKAKLETVTLLANTSELEMLSFLNIEIGDMINVIDTHNDIDNYYYVYTKDWEITQGGIITITYTVKRARTKVNGLSALAIQFNGEASEESIRFPAVKPAASASQKTMICDVYVTSFESTSGTCLFLSDSSNTSGMNRLSVINSGGTNTFFFTTAERDGTEGLWDISTTGSLSTGTWYTIAATYDNSNVNNNPKLYLNGIEKVATEITTPTGDLRDIGASTYFYLGGLPFSSGTPYVRVLDGRVRNARFYNRILTPAEILESVNGLIEEGLIFHAPYVISERLSEYTNAGLAESAKLVDNMYGIIGTPKSIPFGRAYNAPPD